MDLNLPERPMQDIAPLATIATALNLGDELEWQPDHLAPSAWLEHVPFAFWLVKALRPRTIVELGTHWGVSYGAFCQAVARCGLATNCHAVDTWQGDDHAGHYGEEVFAAVATANERHWRRFSNLLRTTFDDARGYFGPGEIDLLHIDGLHTEAAVRHDFETWRETVSDRGVVLFHDTNVRRLEFGVWRLWQSLRAEHPHFEFVHGQGLGVLGLGRDWPRPVAALFKAAEDPEATAAIRNLFAARGESIRLRQTLQEASPQEAVVRAEAALQRVMAERDAALQRAAAELEAARAEQEQLHTRLRRTIAAHAKADAEQEQLRAQRDQALGERDRLLGESAAAMVERNRAVAEAAEARARRDAILQSSSWRVTRPLRIATGLVRRDPAYLAQLRQALLRRRSAPATPGATPAPAITGTLAPFSSEPGVAAVVAQHLPAPLSVFPDPEAPRRLTMVTDSISAGSLFGGVGTAVVLAALLARRLDMKLRVVTRTEPPEPANFGTVLEVHGIAHAGDIEFLHSGPPGVGRCVPMGANDVLLTTSWWTTWAALRAVPPGRILYLLQEDERLFYPAGDQQLRCTEILQDTRLRFIVNTQALQDHLAAAGMTGVARRGLAFEPAFPESIYHREPCSPATSGGRRRFFFYARPNHPRNLYLRGLEAVASAIETGVLPASDWEFTFVGRDVQPCLLPGGIRPRIVQNLPWASYATLIRGMDLGLSLMYTPHPSYPPLDLAASGAVVVTNRCGSKQNLDRYSRNILCADLGVPGLVAALGEGAALAQDEARREANYRASGIERDWMRAFAPVLDRLALDRVAA